MRSIATVAPLRNSVVGGCNTVPVGSLPISPPDDDLRDAKRLKVCPHCPPTMPLSLLTSSMKGFCTTTQI